jgi:hypothetical protein
VPNLPEIIIDTLQSKRRDFLAAWFEACKAEPNNPHRHEVIVSVSNAMHQLAEVARIFPND